MFNIFEEISWPQFVKLNGINKMPLNEQVNAYNQYLYNLDVARQNWVDTQNKGPQLTSTPTPPILGDFLINTENVVEGTTTNDNCCELNHLMPQASGDLDWYLQCLCAPATNAPSQSL